MIGKHLLLTLRSFKKNLLYAVLVIVGLAIGITTFLSTIQWSAWHLTFDRSYPEKEQIYRLTFEEINEGFYRHTARILHGNALNRIIFSDMLSGIENAGRLAPFRKAAFIIGEESYYDKYAFGCDPAFLKIFQPAILHGDPDGLLEEPFTAILTESTASKFFGNNDPIGESFELIHQFGVEPSGYTVTAIIKDFPGNSHFRISVLTAFEDPMEYESTAWTYIKLDPFIDPAEIEDNLKLFIDSNEDASYAERIHPRLQPVSDIHLHSHLAREIQPNIRFRTVLILMITGMLVFLLAWFNFTLLSFSQNQLNIQRLVVQWQMGAGKRIFFRQFLVDNLFVGCISFAAGILLTLLLLPAIEKLGGYYIFQDIRFFLISSSLLMLLIVASSLFTALFSTGRLYRYLQHRYLSSKLGTPPDTTGKNLFIRAVIILEFIITFVLVANLFMISRQTRFAMSEQLGATNLEAIHLHSLHRAIVDDFGIFKEKMLESPHIASVTASMEEPTGQAMDANTFEIDGIDEGEKQLFLFPVDQDFLRFHRLELIHGSDLPITYDPSDSTEFFVLNETAARMVSDNIEELPGSELTLHFNYPGFIWPGPITGIVKDFHLSGLDYEVSPMVIFPKYTWLYCFSVLPAGDPGAAVDHLEVIWEELFPSYPLEFFYSSSLIEQLYGAELVQIRILLIFSVLSIIIAGMGLFALSGFFMQKRVKAAALRKINGARVHQVILPELLYYLWLALLSSALSVPASLFLIERWLRNFKYRTEIPVWIFPVCALILVFFSWIAVFYHSWRLARINPVEFIREH
ncbi:MAG: ABC transporter permease [Bacteroidales bacterium]|nr:ABC transporter permease [Bacteroidales bacterium]